jgi:hypothetical protein
VGSSPIASTNPPLQGGVHRILTLAAAWNGSEAEFQRERWQFKHVPACVCSVAVSFIEEEMNPGAPLGSAVCPVAAWS